MNLYEQYYTLRTERLAIQRKADELEQKEKDILYEITKGYNLGPGECIEGIEGGYRYKSEAKTVALARDWTAILTFIKDSGAVDLLQKRLTESAVKARWDAGVTVPGVEKTFKWATTVTKD